MSKGLIKIEDNFKGYSLDSFFIPTDVKQYLNCVLIPNGLVNDRIEKIATEIALEYTNEPLVALCVLKGGLHYYTKLMEKLKNFYELLCLSGEKEYNTNQITIEFIRVKSYEDDKSTQLKVSNMEVLENLKGKKVLIVEDIIDTGRTIGKLIELIQTYNPKLLKVTSLVVKRKNNQIAFMPDYVGFEVPDLFIVGYNFDYNEHFRGLNHICIINEAGKRKFSIKN